MTNSKTTFNPAAGYPAIFARLETIDGVDFVKPAADLDAVMKAQTTGTDRTAYLLLVRFEPYGEPAKNGKYLKYRVEYGVLFTAVGHDLASRETEYGATVGRIVTTLAGWNPFGDDPRQRSACLRHKPAGDIKRFAGMTIYPLAFEHFFITQGQFQ